MKTLISLTLIAFAAATLTAQSKPTTAGDFNGTFMYAVSETNAAFPFIFTVVTETFEDGKLVSTETEINERQAKGVERETRTLKRGGETLHSYSIMTGFGNNTYCSTDGVSWKGPQKFVCPGPDASGSIRLNRPREPESVEYTVTDTTLAGKPVKVYRKYAVFPTKVPNGKKSFEEEIATIDSRGFFISIVETEGILDPKTITLIRKQAWDLKTKFKPVVAPKLP